MVDENQVAIEAKKIEAKCLQKNSIENIIKVRKYIEMN